MNFFEVAVRSLWACPTPSSLLSSCKHLKNTAVLSYSSQAELHSLTEDSQMALVPWKECPVLTDAL